MGIIEIDARGTPYVVEATVLTGLMDSVIRSSYTDWLASISDTQVWHGRAKDLRAGVRKHIAAEASKQLGKPYKPAEY